MARSIILTARLVGLSSRMRAHRPQYDVEGALRTSRNHRDSCGGQCVRPDTHHFAGGVAGSERNDVCNPRNETALEKAGLKLRVQQIPCALIS